MSHGQRVEPSPADALARTAQMGRGDAIAGVPNGDRQVEVVGPEPALHHTDEGEAGDRIASTRCHARKRAWLRDHLHRQASGVAVERFMAEVREIVAGCQAP